MRYRSQIRKPSGVLWVFAVAALFIATVGLAAAAVSLVVGAAAGDGWLALHRGSVRRRRSLAGVAFRGN